MDDTTGTTTTDPWSDLSDHPLMQEEIATPSLSSTTDLINAATALDEAVEMILAQGEDTWSRISTSDREELYRSLERSRRKFTAADAAMVTSLRVDLAMPCGPRGPRWLARTFGLTLREVKTRVAAADAPVAELVRTAGPDAVADLRPFLTGIAGIDEPYTDDDRARLRGVTIGRQRDDGMSPISGDLTPELASILQRLMADHANPGDLTADADAADAGERGTVQDPAEAESRNPAQRRHDALFAAIAAGYGRGKELAPGRGTTTIVAAVTLEQLAARTGTAVTDAGVRMPVDRLVETCDARDLFLQVMDFHGRSLFLGRSRRLGSVDQYLALVGEEGASSALIHGNGRPSHRRKGVPTGCCGSLRNRWTPPGHRRSPCIRRVGRHRGWSYADSHGHYWAY
ncbi:DUF222 domain-containing protein [Corynebacterium variabile]|uniref:DUF222 domain-containing protein n=1 Tax=Corynebacterium variabile TaxID=1727 RepID=UPI0028A5D48E|nr:DUF222 domain-containing protein [Corynebacterium variabile]